MSQFLMPSLGADMEAGILVEQLIPAGEKVHRGDIIAVVETQKGAIEIEVFEDGTLSEWLIDTGTKVPVGTPMAVINGSAKMLSDVPDPTPEVPQPTDPVPPPLTPEVPQPAEPLPSPAIPEEPAPTPDLPELEQRRKVSPAARRKAAQAGIDLSTIQPAGGHIVTLADVVAQTDVKQSEASSGSNLSPMRAAISAAMSRSKREIPHYYLAQTLDLQAAQDFLTALNAERPPQDRFLIVALFAKAIARALKKYPEFNGHFEDGKFVTSEAVHLGLAINLRGGGLVAPAIFDAETRDLDDLMASIRDLIQRVKSGSFRAREMSAPTITLTSLGDRGVDTLFGVIFPPQVAIIGIGTPAPRAVCTARGIEPRLCATITLAADHRTSDGHRGALFLNKINASLQEPETL